jgi:hypothetical protein
MRTALDPAATQGMTPSLLHSADAAHDLIK